MIAMLSGWLVSWLGVAALITLTVAFSRNPVPWALLVAWAVLAAVSLVIPGASLGGRIRGALLVLALPFMPFLRAAIALWPHLPPAVKDLLEGSFRSHRSTRRQSKQARSAG